MTGRFEAAFRWLAGHVWLVTGTSIVLFLAGLAAAALFAIAMPQDYFAATPHSADPRGAVAAVRMLKRLAKNIVGFVILATGLVLLVMPGPGLVLMLIGISLIDFPGKRALERRFISNPLVLNRINRVRARFGRPPLKVDS